MPSDISQDMLFDRRIAERNLRKGLITQKDFDARLKALSDSVDHAATVEARLEHEAGFGAGLSAASLASEEEDRD